jgi:hypothetical protein
MDAPIIELSIVKLTHCVFEFFFHQPGVSQDMLKCVDYNLLFFVCYLKIDFIFII